MRMAAVAACVALSACAATGPAEPPPARLVPAADGFDVAGTGLQIGFGRAMDGAVAAAARLQGRDPSNVTRLAGCTRASWPDGLSMDFIDGAFAGWVDTAARTGVSRAGRTCA